MRSEATNVETYLAELPEDRRKIISAVREMVVGALPDGFTESMNWGMISYEVPLERYPDTYNKQPLLVAALASQKQNCALYLNGPYMEPELLKAIEVGFAEAGKKLDMGKSCIRFKSVEDLPADVIESALGALDPDRFIALYERSRKR